MTTYLNVFLIRFRKLYLFPFFLNDLFGYSIISYCSAVNCPGKTLVSSKKGNSLKRNIFMNNHTKHNSFYALKQKEWTSLNGKMFKNYFPWTLPTRIKSSLKNQSKVKAKNNILSYIHSRFNGIVMNLEILLFCCVF